MAAIVMVKILKERRNVKARTEASLSKVLHVLDQHRSGRVLLEHFLDIMEEHDVLIPSEDLIGMFELVDEKDEVKISTLIVFCKNASFWKVLEKVEDGEKTKMELIYGRVFKISLAFRNLDQNKDGLVTKLDFRSKFASMSEPKVNLIFNRYQDKNQITGLNFVQFKNFMNRRPPHKDLNSRRSSVISLSSVGSSLPYSDSYSSLPPNYSSLSLNFPPRYSSLYTGESPSIREEDDDDEDTIHESMENLNLDSDDADTKAKVNECNGNDIENF